MPKYAYDELSCDQFESLVVVICQKLLGIGVQGFASGKDGGRDARFDGVAERFPSSNSPWSGVTIVQAKHTSGYNSSFSDKAFFSESAPKCTIAQEVPKIKSLYDKNELNNYILFSNRRLTGGANENILNYISTHTGVPKSNIRIICIDGIENYLKHYPDIVSIARIDPIDSPLTISPNDLSELIERLGANIQGVADGLVEAPVRRTSFERKNEINNMTEQYAEYMRRRFLRYTSEIQRFLRHPANEPALELYSSVVDEFQRKIISKRKDYQSFDDVMNHILDLLFGRDVVLNANKNLTKAMVFYMYWNCDLGVSEKEEEAHHVATD